MNPYHSGIRTTHMDKMPYATRSTMAQSLICKLYFNNIHYTVLSSEAGRRYSLITSHDMTGSYSTDNVATKLIMFFVTLCSFWFCTISQMRLTPVRLRFTFSKFINCNSTAIVSVDKQNL